MEVQLTCASFAFAGNNLFNSVMQSRINIASTSLYRMHMEERVKSIVVSSLLHLLAAIEFIKLTLKGEKALIIFEGLSTLFLSHKVWYSGCCSACDACLDPRLFALVMCDVQANNTLLVNDSLVKDTLNCLQGLIRTQLAIAVWVNSGEQQRC